MPASIGRGEVRRLVAQDAVSPRAEYEWAHLAGCGHLTLKGWDVTEARRRLNPDLPVVVYCNDFQCDMSPRAAWRLETLGFDAHDYVAGNQDGLAHDLPHEGHAILAVGVTALQRVVIGVRVLRQP